MCGGAPPRAVRGHYLTDEIDPNESDLPCAVTKKVLSATWLREGALTITNSHMMWELDGRKCDEGVVAVVVLMMRCRRSAAPFAGVTKLFVLNT